MKIDLSDSQSARGQFAMFLRFLQTIVIGCFILANQSFGIEDKNDNQQNAYIPFEGQRYDALDWNLLKALKSPELGNVLISPVSLKMVLAMLYEGSSGSTLSDFEQVLNLPSNMVAVREKYKEIIQSLESSSANNKLDMGSRIFIDSSLEPQQRYHAIIKTAYNTEIVRVNFNETTATRNKINYWISNVTHGHINDLVGDGDIDNALLLLTNAIYFKGLWRAPFLRKNTTPGLFYTQPNQQVPVSYMYNYGPYYYSESAELDAKILRIPFKDGHLAMFILLPNSKAGLSKLIQDVNEKNLRQHVWLMDTYNVHIYLPKFTFDFNIKFGGILHSLGLKHIFQNTASLAAIARNMGKQAKLMVSDIIQKSGITVNEEGATAFSATEVPLASKFGSHDVFFNATSPFMFYIEDENTGSILFAGKVENPNQTVQPPITNLEVPNRFNSNSNAQSNVTTEVPSGAWNFHVIVTTTTGISIFLAVICFIYTSHAKNKKLSMVLFFASGVTYFFV